MTSDKNICQLLQNLGFSEKESRVYVELLRLGGSFPSVIAKCAKLKRSTVYMILEALILRGMAYKVKRQGQLFFKPLTPKELIQKIEEHQALIESSIGDLGKILPEVANSKVTNKEEQIEISKELQETLNKLITIIEEEVAPVRAIFLSRREDHEFDSKDETAMLFRLGELDLHILPKQI